MIKTLLSQVKEFKKASFLTPVFMILEVVVETMIPVAMARMIDNGVEKGNMSYIYRVGAVMAVLAIAGLIAGFLGGKYGALASSGLPEISGRPCTPIYRHFLFQILTNSAQQV